MPGPDPAAEDAAILVFDEAELSPEDARERLARNGDRVWVFNLANQIARGDLDVACAAALAAGASALPHIELPEHVALPAAAVQKAGSRDMAALAQAGAQLPQEALPVLRALLFALEDAALAERIGRLHILVSDLDLIFENRPEFDNKAPHTLGPPFSLFTAPRALQPRTGKLLFVLNYAALRFPKVVARFAPYRWKPSPAAAAGDGASRASGPSGSGGPSPPPAPPAAAEAVRPLLPGEGEVYLGGLPGGTTEADVRAATAPFGPLRSVSLYPERGFAFVGYEALEGQHRALQRGEVTILGQRVAVVQRRNRPGGAGGPPPPRGAPSPPPLPTAAPHPVPPALPEGSVALRPIGTFESCFDGKRGTPRQGLLCPGSRGRLTLRGDLNPRDALEGLDRFSHVWLIFLFHQPRELPRRCQAEAGRGGAGQNNNLVYSAKVEPPRLGGARVGVFATRSPHRPNSVGLSVARLDRLEGPTLLLSGVDLVDGTPVLDVKRAAPPAPPRPPFPPAPPLTPPCGLPVQALRVSARLPPVSASPSRQAAYDSLPEAACADWICGGPAEGTRRALRVAGFAPEAEAQLRALAGEEGDRRLRFYAGWRDLRPVIEQARPARCLRPASALARA
eukprot:tig00020516_g9969.t1